MKNKILAFLKKYKQFKEDVYLILFPELFHKGDKVWIKSYFNSCNAGIVIENRQDGYYVVSYEKVKNGFPVVKYVRVAESELAERSK